MKLHILLTVLIAACAPQSDSETYVYEPGDPVRVAPAKATSAQFLAVFKSLCLKNFPHQSKMRSAARKLGFSKTHHSKTGSVDLETHEKRSLKLTTRFGNAMLFWHGVNNDGAYDVQSCTLRGHVTDPQNLSAEMVKDDYRSEIAFSDSDSNERNLYGMLKKIGDRSRLSFRLPYLYSVDAGSHVIGADRCEDLPRCRVWREVEFELRLPELGADIQ